MANAYIDNKRQMTRPSEERGQYSEPIVVSSIAIHHSAAPKVAKPTWFPSSRSKANMPAAPSERTTTVNARTYGNPRVRIVDPRARIPRLKDVRRRAMRSARTPRPRRSNRTARANRRMRIAGSASDSAVSQLRRRNHPRRGATMNRTANSSTNTIQIDVVPVSMRGVAPYTNSAIRSSNHTAPSNARGTSNQCSMRRLSSARAIPTLEFLVMCTPWLHNWQASRGQPCRTRRASDPRVAQSQPGDPPALRLLPSAPACHLNTGWIGRAGRPRLPTRRVTKEDDMAQPVDDTQGTASENPARRRNVGAALGLVVAGVLILGGSYYAYTTRSAMESRLADLDERFNARLAE